MERFVPQTDHSAKQNKHIMLFDKGNYIYLYKQLKSLIFLQYYVYMYTMKLCMDLVKTTELGLLFRLIQFYSFKKLNIIINQSKV